MPKLADNVAATTAWVAWQGGTGVFSVVAAAWNSGSVWLEKIGADGVTPVPVGRDTTFVSANGEGLFTLPATAQIRVAIASATGVHAEVNGV